MSSDNQFTCLLLESDANHKVSSSIQTLDNEKLPEGDVLVAVKYSTLNYKDGMVINGLGRLVRNYPHVPGIDFCGVVESSGTPDYKRGDEVILTGWRVGEAHWGGFSTRARLKSDWLVPLPEGLSLKRSMAFGTAGLTAMLAIMTLEEHGLNTDTEGEVLVTGAAGGVGSVAVAMLATLGYKVAASTGRVEQHDYLRDLGATTIVARADLEASPKGPLAAERWIGSIDNVGGSTLHHILTTLKYWSTCAAVGLAAGPNIETTILPFLLRGVNLCGIDSSSCSKARRLTAWARLAKDFPLDKLDALTNEAALAELPDLAGKILQAKIRGRTVIDVNS